MVECGREYVLQWPGHAAYVTERFSGLLARQTLVDVTLICDEQKLRVHKLVLASCSLYFEEILAQDLGSEPIIVLRDLQFSILKAMIEFMYCGETTVSHIDLPSLLAAARLFKVKELESLVEKMVGSITQDHNDNEKEYPSKDAPNSGRLNGMINTDDNGIRVSFTSKHNGQSSYAASESSDSESSQNYLEEINSANLSDSPTERCLYEEPPCDLIPKSVSYPSLRNGEVEHSLNRHREESVESACDSSSTLDSENCVKDYDKCYDFLKNGCTEANTVEEADNEKVNRVGQCARVYTHKKRKVNGVDNSKRNTPIPQQILTSNRIDLDESSNDETPITLNTNLDVESSDYMLSFNSESIQSIVGCSLNDFCSSNSFELLNARTRLCVNDKEKQTGDDNRPPVLRRSVRLKQENEEFTPRLRSKLRDDKKSKSDMKLFSRTKRKNKELERRVPNVKVILSPQPAKKNQRKASKLVGQKCSTKNHLTKHEKEVVKPKTTTEQNKLTHSTNATSSTETNAENHVNEITKPNTTASSVNRALWGDMSDVAEDGEVDDEFLEYSTSAEIPFAVGLLPLRAALERMQATLDHQPRKTRSSVATKQDANILKRKHSPAPTNSSKKHHTNDSEVDENPSAVCHIQIRTSPQCSRPRKRSLSDGAASLGQATGNS